MKLATVTKLDKRNKKKETNLTMTSCQKKCEVNAIFSIYGQFGAIRKPDSGRLVCKTYLFINDNLSSYKI